MEKNLKEYLLELSNKYIPEKVMNETIKENYCISVSSKNHEVLQSFLKEFAPFQFESIIDYNDANRYFSKNMSKTDSEVLARIIRAKKTIIDDKVYDEKDNYKINIENSLNEIDISSWYDINKQNKEKEFIETRKYIKLSLLFEQRLINTDYRNDFCNEIISLVNHHTNYKSLLSSNNINQDLKEFVYDTYDTAYKLAYKNKLSLQSHSNPELFTVVNDSRSYKMDDDLKLLIKQITSDRLSDKIYAHVDELMSSRYTSFDLLKPIHDMNEMNEINPFNTALDREKFTMPESSYSIADRLTTNYEDRSNNGIFKELIFSIQKSAIYQAQIVASFELHNLLINNNGNKNNYKELFKDFFNTNRFEIEKGIEQLEETKIRTTHKPEKKPKL